MEGINFLEWFGYLASVVVAISLLMGTIVKLRILNLIGSLFFSAYGFMIGAIPVGVLNGFVVLVNLYYLNDIYRKKEYFRVLPFEHPTPYLTAFIDFYRNDIQRFFPGFDQVPEGAKFNFAVLRNMAVASVFVGRELADGTVEVLLDFAAPEYRDMKPARFVFRDNISFFTQRGYSRLVVRNYSVEHAKYLSKLGFVPDVQDGEKFYTLNLSDKK